MLAITDSRTDPERRLENIPPSGFFVWGEDVYRRIEANIEADIRYKADGIPCVHQRTGDLTIIDRDAWVVPCECELTIVG